MSADLGFDPDLAVKTLAALDALGSADHIAAYLHNQRVCGVVGDAYDCPVSAFLAREVPGLHPSIGYDGEGTFLTVEGRPTADFEVRVPRNVADFITAFDAGLYPVLVAGSADPSP